MNPAPPVIIIFLTSGSGSYFVLPVKTGASFHTPKSSKNLFAAALEIAGQSVSKKFTYVRQRLVMAEINLLPLFACSAIAIEVPGVSMNVDG
jgi:hypothetical protein